MGEKTPDTDESGIERRNVLKGLGFGAMTAVGAGAFAGNVAGQDGRGSQVDVSQESMIDYAHLVEPGADADEPTGSFSDSPDGGMDLVFQLDAPGMGQDDSKTVAYQVTFVRQNEDNNVVTNQGSGRTKGFAGTVQTSPGGETQHREEFSTSGLSTGEGESPNYWVVLAVADYSELNDSITMDAATIEASIN